MLHRPVGTVIGMSDVKRRRLALPVACHPDIKVGECVPFYFCPRSVMLYVIHCANHPALAYAGGQSGIVHLEADLREVAAWAARESVRWSFTTMNAAIGTAAFFDDLDFLDKIDWDAVHARQWRDRRDAKQAEFLEPDNPDGGRPAA